MLLLTDQPPAESPARTFAIFGAGLIGSAIIGAMRAAARLKANFIPVDWSDPASFARDLASTEMWIGTALDQSRHSTGSEPGRNTVCVSLRLLWSAGRAGFGASDEETRLELDKFTAVLQMLDRIGKRTQGISITFYLISSAGGLFEGQRNVSAESVTAPRRPYGRLKQKQEELLQASTLPMVKKVYRLTSVYGYVRHHQRQGLIPSLIANGLAQQVCRISGRPTTLRDFIWIDDVAAFMSRALLNDDEAARNSLSLLASSKPSSILEIQQYVVRTLRHALYVAYEKDAGNGEDMSFAHAATASGWRSTDLQSNIRKIYAEAVTSGTVHASGLQ